MANREVRAGVNDLIAVLKYNLDTKVFTRDPYEEDVVPKDQEDSSDEEEVKAEELHYDRSMLGIEDVPDHNYNLYIFMKALACVQVSYEAIKELVIHQDDDPKMLCMFFDVVERSFVILFIDVSKLLSGPHLAQNSRISDLLNLRNLKQSLENFRIGFRQTVSKESDSDSFGKVLDESVQKRIKSIMALIDEESTRRKELHAKFFTGLDVKQTKRNDKDTKTNKAPSLENSQESISIYTDLDKSQISIIHVGRNMTAKQILLEE